MTDIFIVGLTRALIGRLICGVLQCSEMVRMLLLRFFSPLCSAECRLSAFLYSASLPSEIQTFLIFPYLLFPLQIILKLSFCALRRVGFDVRGRAVHSFIYSLKCTGFCSFFFFGFVNAVRNAILLKRTWRCFAAYEKYVTWVRGWLSGIQMELIVPAFPFCRVFSVN